MVTRRLPMRHAPLVPLLALLALVAGCELGSVTVVSPTPGVVVHAVLNPDATEQVILLEETQVGRIDINDGIRYNPLEPVRTAGGLPINDADVRLLVDGDSVGVRATETVVSGRKTGRYVVPQAALAIVPGRRYRLRARTTTGAVVTGTTIVPAANPGQPAVATQPVTLARSSDTLRLAWGAVPDATIYGIRLETPNGPWFLFSDSTRFALAGTLRNFFADGLPYVFFPGFTQPLAVIAADRNFYDYNRSGNDPFGGTGLISSVQGGIGVFGSVRMLLRRDVTVTDVRRAPVEGSWRGTALLGASVSMELWREALAAPTATAQLSGRQRVGGTDRYLLGSIRADTVRFAVLTGFYRSDTSAFFTGRLAGDSITGTYSTRFATDGPRVFRRVP
ncbi:MAG: DUF4249 family protein [Gemmatimonadetes bacterium]|nr:DUF4249 family protein [Gemmatimonadota bacterium]